MIDGQLIRRDDDVLGASAHSRREARVEQLKQHLSPRDAQAFGIDQPYDEGDAAVAVRHSLLRGLGATLASTTLFVTIGALSIPAAAFA